MADDEQEKIEFLIGMHSSEAARHENRVNARLDYIDRILLGSFTIAGIGGALLANFNNISYF